MRYIFTLILLMCATMAFYYSTRIFYNKNYKNKNYQLFALTSLGSGLWSLGYGFMLPFDSEGMFLVFRAIGISGLFIFLIAAQLMLLIIGDNTKHLKLYVTVATILGLIVFSIACNPGNVRMIHTDYGIITQFTRTIWSLIYTLYTAVMAVCFIGITIAMLRPSKPMKVKAFGKNLLVVEGLVLIGMFIDTILPALGTNYNIPASTILQFFGLAIIYRAMHAVNRNTISMANMASYMYESLKMPVFVVDAKHRVQISNREASKVFSLPDIIGYPASMLWMQGFGIEEPGNIKGCHETILLDGENKKHGYKLKLYVDAIYDEYRDYLGYILTVQDMTMYYEYTKRLEESEEKAQKANQAKSQFLANMSHEIRTPMNSILGFSEIALSDDIDDNSRGYFNDIHDSAENLLVVINDILDISKIEAGKIELIEIDYETDKLLRDIANITLINAKRKNLGFEMDVDKALPKALYGDFTKIRQVLINILNNGVKYTNEGFIKLTVVCESQDEDYCDIKFEISDTGIGIKKEEIGLIFQKFSRVDGKVNSQTEGTGLGLSISKGFIELMNGTVTVDSEYGKGSVFTIRLTQKISKELNTTNTEEVNSTKGKLKLRDVKILAVDDNAMNLKVITLGMKHYGVKIDNAISGSEAIVMCQDTKYDLVFMDQMMPVMDGVEAMHKIREIGGAYAKGGTSRIIALTANVVEEAKAELLAEGFDDFVGKPINFSVFDKQLVTMLREDMYYYE